MSEAIIEVNNLSKAYRINHEQKVPYHTLKEDIATAVANPFKRLKSKKRTSEQFWALKDINFSVNQGDVVGIIGHNGSGKSTLLKILSRIVEPTTGEVKLRGRVASLLEVGTGFHLELTGRENIFLNGAILGMKRAEIARKFDDIVEFSGVERFLDTPVKFYSSGMYVRLAFAVAAHIESDILLVDEVLSVGDADFQRKSLGKMDDITKRQGRTIIYVSHNMDSVIALCNKALLLESGQIKDSGDVSKIAGQYLNQRKNMEENVSLDQRPDRWGTKKLTFKTASVDISRIEQQKLELTIRVMKNSEQPVIDPKITAEITTNRGQIVCNMANFVSGDKLDIDKAETVIKLTIDNANLAPGDYQINLLASADKTNTEVYDAIKSATRFSVPEYDYYGTSQQPPEPGLLYLNYKYEVAE